MGAGAKFVSDDLTLTLHRVGDTGAARHRARRPHRTLRRRHPRDGQPQRRGDGGCDARDGRRRAEAHPGGRDERDATRHHALLAGLDQPLDLPRAVARDGRPLGDHPQADDLRADGRPRGRADGRPARAGGRRAQLGLPLHVDPRRVLLGLRAARPRLHRGGGGVRRVADGPRARERRHGVRSAEDHVPRRRLLRPRRGEPRALRRIPRIATGAHRQRRRRPAPARHLRRGDGLDPPRRHPRPAAPARRLDPDQRACSTGSATTGTSPTRASGRRAAAGRTSRSAASCAGWRSTAASASPNREAGRLRSCAGASSATRSTSEIMRDGWDEERGAFVQHQGTDVLDASNCC